MNYNALLGSSFFEDGPQPWGSTSLMHIGSDTRLCFGIDWFASEEDAMAAHELVSKDGATYNGGYFHGMACGRDQHHDREHPETGKVIAWAVTR